MSTVQKLEVDQCHIRVSIRVMELVIVTLLLLLWRDKLDLLEPAIPLLSSFCQVVNKLLPNKLPRRSSLKLPFSLLLIYSQNDLICPSQFPPVELLQPPSCRKLANPGRTQFSYTHPHLRQIPLEGAVNASKDKATKTPKEAPMCHSKCPRVRHFSLEHPRSCKCLLSPTHPN